MVKVDAPNVVVVIYARVVSVERLGVRDVLVNVLVSQRAQLVQILVVVLSNAQVLGVVVDISKHG